MNLFNATRMPAACTIGIEAGGRELLVIVIKGTFRLPRPGQAVELLEEQLPLVMADTFYGEPGNSAPRDEIDFAPRKHRCDVLLHGSAYAPGGAPAVEVPVGMRVGSMSKSFAVVGDRYWDAGLTGIRATPPIPFVRQSISYDVAFGGVDEEHEDPAKHGAYLLNPVGKGYRKHLKDTWVNGRRLPNTEALDEPITRPDGHYRPMAFGPLGRGWSPRVGFSGTYDQRWLDEDFPFLPSDFDERYYQAAPQDQQMLKPQRETRVTLMNLTPDGQRDFVLPHFEAPVHIFPKQGEREDFKASLDTLVFEPDEERFTMTWRVCRPVERDLFEIAQVMVGKKGREWWQQREEVRFPIPVVMVPLKRSPEAVSSP